MSRAAKGEKMHICSFFVLSDKQGSGTGLTAGEVTLKLSIMIFRHVSHIHVGVNLTNGYYTATNTGKVDI